MNQLKQFTDQLLKKITRKLIIAIAHAFHHFLGPVIINATTDELHTENASNVVTALHTRPEEVDNGTFTLNVHASNVVCLHHAGEMKKPNGQRLFSICV